LSTPSTRTAVSSRAARPPRCWFCSSTDTMAPFRRPARVFLISSVLPVRWRYCRACARHFITTGRPRA
jgi:hypothetical protein